MRVCSRLLRTFGNLLLLCNLLCAGCSALIAYSGEDVGKLEKKEQVHKSFGTPIKLGIADGQEFEEYRTHRKISEPEVAGVNFILGAESLGLLEIWMFPAAILQNTWNTLIGLTLRFEYGSNGDVVDILINGTPMEYRASLP